MENQKEYYTLCIPFTHKYIQLRVNNNGVAGHSWGGYLRQLQPGETFAESAQLSMFGQVDKQGPKSPEPVGFLELHYYPSGLRSVYVYRLGGITKNIDDKSFWFYVDDLPLTEISAVDQVWVKLLLEGKKFYMGIYHDAQGRQSIGSFFEEARIKTPQISTITAASIK